MNNLIRRVDRLVPAWPAPAAVAGIVALVISVVGESSHALEVALAGAAASLLLARIEMSRRRAEIGELQVQIQNALSHDGFMDIETGLGTLATLRVDWARQLARYQRHGERFSVALIDVRENGSPNDPSPEVMIAAADRLRALVRTEDTLYRITPGRLAVLLAGADADGAAAFIERAAPTLSVLNVEGSLDPAIANVTGEVIDWREGVGPFPEHRLLWDADASETTSRLLRRWSGQHTDADSGGTHAA